MGNNELWGKIIKSAISLPGVNIDREAFLRKELRNYCNEINLENAIKGSPTTYISKEEASKIARGCIKYHLISVTSISALAGIPGGWFSAATIPTDITQFYGQILALSQKLMYIYGFPDIKNKNNDIDDNTLAILTICVGVMLGEHTAMNGLKSLLNEFSKQIANRLPKQALTKYAIYNIAKQVAKWLGIKLTKDTFSKGVGKLVPLVGAPISAGVTYWTFKPMAYKLKNHLAANTYK